jgi:hypothetical protein
MKKMKKLMITTACLVALTGSAGSTAPVEQKDVLLVVLEEANHNRRVLDAFCIRPDGTTETGGSGPLE